MGVGRPRDILEAVACGIDMFDCVMPTRNGRNALAFTVSRRVALAERLPQARSGRRWSPIVCATRAAPSAGRYLHHLFQADEMLGPTLLSLHNVAFYLRLMGETRRAIEEGRFESFRAGCLARWGASA